MTNPEGSRGVEVSPRSSSYTASVSEPHFKDAVLDSLSNSVNVAQFVSFGPGPELPLRYVRIHGCQPGERFESVEEAVGRLFDRCIEHSVNVRSFDPDQPKGHEFLYGLTSVDEVVGAVRRFADLGLYTIVNETIDVDDGGVSGVSYAGLLEFAPLDTPRCVEMPGTVTFRRDLGLRILETVYGFRPTLDYEDDLRVEFSIHPLKRGVRREHTIIWELERAEALPLHGQMEWPNRFSRFVGDKAFGLLVADAVGLPVPATTVIARQVAPFKFGRPTGSQEYWIRTCPAEPVPGFFTTKRGWIDPFRLIAAEDREPTKKGRVRRLLERIFQRIRRARKEHRRHLNSTHQISSILAQEGVDAAFSGALVTSADGRPLVEGVPGTGEDFMQGRVAPQPLPQNVSRDILSTYDRASERLGPVRLEWVHDGRTMWVVQLHRGTSATVGRVIYPGEPTVEHRFPVVKGLEALRSLIQRIEGTGEGIVLIGEIGVTSHIGEALCRARIPSRIEPAESRGA